MRKLLTLLPVAALALAAACQDQPTSLRQPGQVATPDAPEVARVTGASFTTDNPAAVAPNGETDGKYGDGVATRGCVHGNLKDPTPAVNCNLYNAKEKVWINGGPKKVGASALTPGIYFFAILEPGGQGGNNNPNDGTPKNLSDTDPQGGQKTAGCSNGTGCGDAYTNRTFEVGADGEIVKFFGKAGSHRTSTAFPENGLMIAPYYFDDTSNPGGVYILAICRISGKSTFDNSNKTYNPSVDPVTPDDCKYDAFKVHKGTEPPTLDAIISIEPDATNGITEPHTFKITATALGGTPNESASPNYHFTVSTTLKQVKDGVEVNPNPDPTTGNTCSDLTVENAVTVSCTLTINSNIAGTFKAYASVTVKDYGTSQLTATASTNGEKGSSGPATKTYVDAGLRWEKVDDSHPADHIGGAVFTIERTMDRFGNELSPSDPIITEIEDCVAASADDCTGDDKNPNAGFFRVDGLQFGTWKITETKAPDGYRMADPVSQSVITDLNKPIGKVEKPFVNPKIPPLAAKISIKKNETNGITEPHTFTITATASGGTPNPEGSASPKYGFAISTTLKQVKGNVEDNPVSDPTTGNTCGNLKVEGDAEVSCTLTINSSTAATFRAYASVTVTDYGTPQQTAKATTDGKGDNSGPATKTYVDASLSWEKVDDGNPAKHLAGATFKIERTHDRFGSPLTPSDPTITGITDCTSTQCAGRDKDARAGYFLVEDLPFGTWRITETQAPAGYNLANPAFKTVVVKDLTDPTNDATLTFVNPGKYSGETATGGGYPWSATKNAPSNWFMYSPWNAKQFSSLAKLKGFTIALDENQVGTVFNGATVQVLPLIAGQQYIAGTITGTRNGTTSLTIKLDNGFRFAAGSGNVKVHPMDCPADPKKFNYMQPGQFSVKQKAGVSESSVEVKGLANTSCYGIHVDVERPLFPN